MRLFEKIANKNKKEALIESGDRIVVGFSGGPDSVFLVEMLLKLKEKLDFNIVLVHINHLLRGEEAQRDEDFSIEYGRSRGLEVFARKIDITSLGKEKGLSLEEAGREGRYRYQTGTCITLVPLGGGAPSLVRAIHCDWNADRRLYLT